MGRTVSDIAPVWPTAKGSPGELEQRGRAGLEHAGPVLGGQPAAYLQHAATSGEHPRLARLLSQAPAPAGPADGYRRIVTRIPAGLPDATA